MAGNCCEAGSCVAGMPARAVNTTLCSRAQKLESLHVGPTTAMQGEGSQQCIICDGGLPYHEGLAVPGQIPPLDISATAVRFRQSDNKALALEVHRPCTSLLAVGTLALY